MDTGEYVLRTGMGPCGVVRGLLLLESLKITKITTITLPVAAISFRTHHATQGTNYNSCSLPDTGPEGPRTEYLGDPVIRSTFVCSCSVSVTLS